MQYLNGGAFSVGVYRPDPEYCCEACVFGRGEHAIWCRAQCACRAAETDVVMGCDCQCHD